MSVDMFMRVMAHLDTATRDSSALHVGAGLWRSLGDYFHLLSGNRLADDARPELLGMPLTLDRSLDSSHSWKLVPR
jgi:hypothetical protein